MVRIFANSDMYVTANDLKVFTVLIKMDGIKNFQISVKKKTKWKENRSILVDLSFQIRHMVCGGLNKANSHLKVFPVFKFTAT